MLTKIVKWTAIAALIGGAFDRSWANLELVLQFAISAAAVVALAQAASMRRYIWMSLFILVACLFNPFFPVPMTAYISGIASTFAVLLFFFSLDLLQPKPRPTIASITDRLPGSESL